MYLGIIKLMYTCVFFTDTLYLTVYPVPGHPKTKPVCTLLSHVYLSIPVYPLYSYVQIPRLLYVYPYIPKYPVYPYVSCLPMYTHLSLPTIYGFRNTNKHITLVNGIKFPHSLSHITHSLVIVNSRNSYCSYSLFVLSGVVCSCTSSNYQLDTQALKMF